jgi:hypothetical protein
MSGPTPITERAYEIARSGSCADVVAIRNQLRAEGYDRVGQYIQGRALVRALNVLCQSALRPKTE